MGAKRGGGYPERCRRFLKSLAAYEVSCNRRFPVGQTVERSENALGLLREMDLPVFLALLYEDQDIFPKRFTSTNYIVVKGAHQDVESSGGSDVYRQGLHWSKEIGGTSSKKGSQ